MDESDLMSVVLGCSGEKQEAPKRAPPSLDPLSFLAPLPPPSPPTPFFSMAEMESLAMAPFDLPGLSTMSGGTFGGLEDILPRPQPEPQPQPSLQLQKELQQQQQEGFFVPSLPSSTVGGFVHPTAIMVPESPQPPPPQKLQTAAAARVKKGKKNQHKKVSTQVSPDTSGPNDNWAWRKYGQKPIKGSPYPRGYYRCSTAKSCPARKQVEKSWANPGMYIITYSEDHTHPLPTHRNSLAGSIRNKHSTPSSSGSRKGGAGDHTHSASLSGFSPTTPLTKSPFMEEEDDDDEEEGEGMLRVEDMEIAGEDELLFLGNGSNASSSATSMEAMAKAAESAVLDGGEEEDPFFSELCNNTSYNGW